MINVLLLALALSGQATATDTLGTTQATELSRSPIPDSNCGMAISGAGGTATRFVMPASGLTWTAPLPAQVMITNSSTAAVTYCFSQDSTPVGISRHWYFTADDVGYYGAGQGPCFTLGVGSWIVMMTKGEFDSGTTATPRPGKKPWRCTNPLYNCANTPDCISGTCAAANGASLTTHLFAVHGNSGGESTVCVAR
jgi:hypothetical protein